MSPVHPASAVSAIPASRTTDAGAADGKRREPPTFSRTQVRSLEKLAPSSVDRVGGSPNVPAQIQAYFDALAPANGIYSRTLEFNSAGQDVKIVETGSGQLFVDFPQLGRGMLMRGDVCVPTGNSTLVEVALMQEATLRGLESAMRD